MIISDLDKPYIFLSSLECSLKKALSIFEVCGGEHNFFAQLNNPTNIFKQSLGALFDKTIEKYRIFSFETLQKYCDKNKIGIITYISEKYPECLKNLDQPPLVIYTKGNEQLLYTNGIAIVGTRTPSFYGREITENFSKKIASYGLTIVSGLAMGVDKIAHESCLKVNGNTIAVLGNGFEHMYPAININLSKEIEQKGLLITEKFPSLNATVYSFPARNRIIAALSRAVLITEAGQKSGALQTKNFALELGKDIFCVPGNINSAKSCATNNLIKIGHASCVTCAEDILKQYDIQVDKKSKQVIQLDFEQANIVKLLKLGEKDFDFLKEKTKMSVKTLNTCLTTLQISGIIKKLPGNNYSLAFGGQVEISSN